MLGGIRYGLNQCQPLSMRLIVERFASDCIHVVQLASFCIAVVQSSSLCIAVVQRTYLWIANVQFLMCCTLVVQLDAELYPICEFFHNVVFLPGRHLNCRSNP